MINWPATLAREIVKERCILFLGSGISASAKGPDGRSPPTWKSFLEGACALVPLDKGRAAIAELIAERKYLLALQAIKDNANRATYYDYLNRMFNVPYEPSRLHEIIYELDAKIVLTTNFDKIYESYCLSYRPGGHALHKLISYKSDALADEVRDDTRLIVRAHGSIDDVREMIFTRSEYHEAKRNHVAFYEMMKALFLTNTIVFLGCSLDDPDILLLLEDVKIIGRHEKPHYAVVREGETSPFVANDLLKTCNVQLLEYGPSYGDLVPELEALQSLVNGEKIP
jgi:NAD-dependent SIR2 family protein deacetylase